MVYLQNNFSCLIFSLFQLFFLLPVLQPQVVNQGNAAACYLWRTEELLQTSVVVLLLCVVLFIVSLLPEVLLWMKGLFVNSSGVSQLGEFCKGWGVQCVFAKNTWTYSSNFYCLRLLAAALMGFFLSLLLPLSFSWFIIKSEFNHHGDYAELFTYQCEVP